MKRGCAHAIVSRLITLDTRTYIPLGGGGAPISQPDIVLGYLDRSLPTSMVARVATVAQLDAAFGGLSSGIVGTYVQGVAFDQHLGASIVEFSGFGGAAVSFRKPRLPGGAAVAELFHAAHPGDSGRPVFLLWGDQAVLLCTYYYAGWGSSVPFNLAAISRACAAEGQSLTYVNFEVMP